MWIRTQDKSTLLECSMFKVEKRTQCSKERCDDKIAEKYKLRRLPRNNYYYDYYAFSADQLAAVDDFIYTMEKLDFDMSDDYELYAAGNMYNRQLLVNLACLKKLNELNKARELVKSVKGE